MIKLTDLLNEQTDIDDYSVQITDYIHKTVKKIGNFDIDVDSRSGTLYLYHKSTPSHLASIFVMATPFWEGQQSIPFEMSDDGSPMYFKNIPLKPTFDLDKDTKKYVSIIKPLLSKLEKKYNFK